MAEITLTVIIRIVTSSSGVAYVFYSTTLALVHTLIN